MPQRVYLHWKPLRPSSPYQSIELDGGEKGGEDWLFDLSWHWSPFGIVKPSVQSSKFSVMPGPFTIISRLYAYSSWLLRRLKVVTHHIGKLSHGLLCLLIGLVFLPFSNTGCAIMHALQGLEHLWSCSLAFQLPIWTTSTTSINRLASSLRCSLWLNASCKINLRWITTFPFTSVMYSLHQACPAVGSTTWSTQWPWCFGNACLIAHILYGRSPCQSLYTTWPNWPIAPYSLCCYLDISWGLWLLKQRGSMLETKRRDWEGSEIYLYCMIGGRGLLLIGARKAVHGMLPDSSRQMLCSPLPKGWQAKTAKYQRSIITAAI